MSSQMRLISLRVPDKMAEKIKQVTTLRKNSFKFHGAWGKPITSSAILREIIETGLVKIATKLGPPKKKAKAATKRHR